MAKLEKGIWRYMKTAPKDREIVGRTKKSYNIPMRWDDQKSAWVAVLQGNVVIQPLRWRMVAQERSDEHSLESQGDESD